MPENYDIIPKAPVAPSMLPRATALTLEDILVLTQPGNPIGQKSRSLTLDMLRSFVWGAYENFNRIKNAVHTSESASMSEPYHYLDVPLIEVPPSYVLGAVDLDFVCTDSVAASNWGDAYLQFSAGVGTYSPVVPGDYTRKYPAVATESVITPDKFVGVGASGNPHFTAHFTPNYKNDTEAAVLFHALVFANIPGVTTSNWKYTVNATCLIPQEYETA